MDRHTRNSKRKHDVFEESPRAESFIVEDMKEEYDQHSKENPRNMEYKQYQDMNKEGVFEPLTAASTFAPTATAVESEGGGSRKNKGLILGQGSAVAFLSLLKENLSGALLCRLLSWLAFLLVISLLTSACLDLLLQLSSNKFLIRTLAETVQSLVKNFTLEEVGYTAAATVEGLQDLGGVASDMFEEATL